MSHARHRDITEAGDRIREIGYNFDHSASESVDRIRARLETLRNAALDIASVSKVIELCVDNYSKALEELRAAIAQRLEAAIPGVVVVAHPVKMVVKCAAPIFNKDLDDPVYTTVARSSFTVIVTSLPFAKLPALDIHAAQLRDIIAVPIVLMEDESGGGGNPESRNSVPAPVLTTASEQYVRNKHYPGGGLNSEWKSTFYASEGPYALVEAAKNSPAIDQGDGTYRREVTVADRYIGNESAKRGGAATQHYIVVQDRFGAVITMHPAGDG